MNPIDTLAAALAGATICYALMRTIATAATVDALRKRVDHHDAKHQNHHARLDTIESQQHEHGQRIEGVSRAANYRHGGPR